MFDRNVVLDTNGVFSELKVINKIESLSDIDSNVSINLMKTIMICRWRRR